MFNVKSKIMNKIILLSGFILSMYGSFAQTLVHGGLYANTTWTLANSPYIMDGSVVVFPGVTLTIEPGVEIRVRENGYSGSQFYLETRGTINMIGKPNSLITIRSETALTSNYAWAGIVVKNSQGGAINYDYVSISNATYAIYYDSYVPDLINLNQCEFKYNTNALVVGLELNADSCTFIGNSNAVYGWSIFKFTNCLFDNNLQALPIYTSDLLIQDCIFTNNYYGLNISSGVYNGMYISNTLFDNNSIAIQNANNGIVEFCTFTNNEFGVTYSNTVEIRNSTFSENSTALQVGWGTIVNNCEITGNETGVAIGPVEFGQPSPVIQNNRICSNTNYNIDNRTDLNLFIPTNCFCSSDSTEIESKILDGYDDFTKGLISYAIFDTTCTTVIETVFKEPLTSVSEKESKPEVTIYPNPAAGFIIISNNTSFSRAEIIDIQGRIHTSTELATGDVELALTEIPAGAYVVRLSGPDKNTEYKRIIKL